jgi:hypothetical protein
MSALGVLARIATEVAEDQWGLVTRTQALGIGAPQPTLARLAKAGVLVRVAHGVYRIAGGTDPGNIELRAAWLQLDPATPAWRRAHDDRDAVVSHRSAAEMYGLGDLVADVHEFTVSQRRQTRREDVRFYINNVARADRALVGGLPVTRPHCIVADLLAAHEDGSAVAEIAHEAIHRGLTTRDEIEAAVSSPDVVSSLFGE